MRQHDPESGGAGILVDSVAQHVEHRRIDGRWLLAPAVGSASECAYRRPAAVIGAGHMSRDDTEPAVAARPAADVRGGDVVSVGRPEPDLLSESIVERPCMPKPQRFCRPEVVVTVARLVVPVRVVMLVHPVDQISLGLFVVWVAWVGEAVRSPGGVAHSARLIQSRRSLTIRPVGAVDSLPGFLHPDWAASRQDAGLHSYLLCLGASRLVGRLPV